MKAPLLTAERARELLSYDSITGELRWRQRMGSRAPVGGLAGSLDIEGYRQVKIAGHVYKAHRLIWLMVHGEWPALQIDHKNCDRGDNRLGNLRLATRAQNAMNCGAPVTNTSGAKGVSRYRDKWRSRIHIAGRERQLGIFSTVEEAAAAYAAAAKEHFGNFARPA